MQFVLRRLRLLLHLEMGGLATTEATQQEKTVEIAQIESMLQSTTFFSSLDFYSVLVDGFFCVNLNRSIHSDVEK